MRYPNVSNLKEIVQQIEYYAQLQTEYGAACIQPVLDKAQRQLATALAELQALPVDANLAQRRPNDLNKIRALRPHGPRRLWLSFDETIYRQRLEGALLGRMAGCTLGAPVEFYTIEKMEALARENQAAFPPQDYWGYVPEPNVKRYGISRREEYTCNGMNGVPVDDDLVYTLLGLLLAEEYGPDFTTDDVGAAWLKYLPHACTAEDIALQNLKAGISAMAAGARNNPYCEWIGADIRSDPWGYMAPGWPERAAAMAYRDAYISHRREGIYGEMYFAAVIAAAFAVADPVKALEIGLTEIPSTSAMAATVLWALSMASEISSYREARAAVDSRFPGMSGVHTLNNACLTIWGITIGGTDFNRVIGETVAMGLDNDCTAATAGSIVGAVVGKDAISTHWYRSFNDTVYSYIIGHEKFAVSDLVERFTRQAMIVSES